MSSILSAELSATCNALGTFDKKSGKYLVDDFTLNTVKDLIRYLRRDGEEHEIRRHFGQTKVLQTDLLPMLIDHWENTELFDVTLRLLVNLTNPALLLYHEEVPVERTARHNYLQILSHLQSYKEESFTKVEVWTVFAKKLAKILEIDWSERDDDTGLVIERILILIRNILHVPADLDYERRPESDASLHDQVLWALNQSGMLDIILYMSSENEKQYFMHILEIISHLLREQNPSTLAEAGLQRTVEEKLRDERHLLALRSSEARGRSDKLRHFSGTRHSRFGGTYVVQNIKSISDNEMICLKPFNNIAKLEFSGNKKEKYCKPKNRRPVHSGRFERRSPFAVRLFLKEFCIEFLNSSYNRVMRHAREVLSRSGAQAHDDSYYLSALQYFMQFNRGHRFSVALVSETMSVQMFHYVQQQMEKYYDMIKVEKKKYACWSRRLQLALKAYKELFSTLAAMDKDDDVTVRQSSKVLKSNIFYVLEYREFVINILLNYDECKMPRSYLVELIETVHLFLKMLEHFCKKTGLVVQKKLRKKNKSKKRTPSAAIAPLPAVPPPPQWEELQPQLAVVLSDTVLTSPECPAPFDAASDVPIDDQREQCLRNIQRCMQQHNYEHAILTLRAAREVWPSQGIFGSEGISPDEELDILRCVYCAELRQQHDAEQTENTTAQVETQGDSDDEEDEEEEQVKSTAIVESDFDFQEFVTRFCHPRVVSACVSLLEHYSVLSAATLHCVTKLLHRLAVECRRPALLYQASLFLVFQKILHNPAPHYQELEKFAIYILREFSARAQNEPKLFIELLFWKNCKDAADIQHGYDLYQDNKDQPARGKWSQEQEDELRTLYLENQVNPQTDKDVIDWILENLIDQSRSRRGVISKLKELGLIFRAPTKRSNRDRARATARAGARQPTPFTEQEDEMLVTLWGQYGQTADPIRAISGRMSRDVERKRDRASCVERLLQLGVIQDRSECERDRGSSSSENEEKSSPDTSDSEAGSSTTHAHSHRSATGTGSKSTVSTSGDVFNADLLASLLVQAVQHGLSPALRWVCDSLEEVAADQQAEGYLPAGEGVPLVPLHSECVEAALHPGFLAVLPALGAVPPTDQEVYWRIPSTLHFDTIRERRDIILRALNGELVIDTDIRKNNTYTAHTESGQAQASSSDDDDLFDNLRRIRDNNTDSTLQVNKSINRKRSRSLESPDHNNREKMQKIDEGDEKGDNNESDDDDNDILSFAKKTLQQAEVPDTEDITRHITAILSDESDNEEDLVLTSTVSTRGNRKRRALIDDSD